VLLSLVAAARGQAIVRWFVRRHRAIEVGAGILLVIVGVLDLVDKWDEIVLTLGA
jgi:cytochrome c biogenesis protein CcdA